MGESVQPLQSVEPGFRLIPLYFRISVAVSPSAGKTGNRQMTRPRCTDGK